MTTYFQSSSPTWNNPGFGSSTNSFGGGWNWQPGIQGSIGAAPSTTPTPSYGSSTGGGQVLPIIGGILGAAGAIGGAAIARSATRDAANTAVAGTLGANRIAGKYGVKRDKLDYELQKKAREADVFQYSPAQRSLMASFAASPLAQKLSAQEFYNQRALSGGAGFTPLAGGSPFYRV